MKPRVLMLAYACDPQGTGEHWLGWGWAEQAARNFQVELITTPKARPAIEANCAQLGITPHFVETPPVVRSVTEHFGGAWWRKWAWQTKALKLARRLHAQNPFALVHQTTFHTFRVPFRAASLGIPSVWGPIAGGECVPPGFESYLGSARFSEAARHRANLAWLRMRAIRTSLEQTSVLFISNRTTLNYLPSHLHSKCVIVPPNALRPEDEQWTPQHLSPEISASDLPSPPLEERDRERRTRDAERKPFDREGKTPFRFLYVGNCVATRAIPLVFEALNLARPDPFEFNIVGAGPALPAWQKLAQQYQGRTSGPLSRGPSSGGPSSGESGSVFFRGKVPFKDLASYYAAADVLVFPALRDSGGSALLEAMARYVPVICLDWAGPGEMLDANSGIKIAVSNPIQTVSDFAHALLRLQRDPDLRAKLAAAARRRAESSFRWEAKRLLLEQTYHRLLTPPS